MLVVEWRNEAFCDAPKGVTRVVVIRQNDLPRIFVEIQNPLGVDVAFARLKRRLYDPNPMQFIATSAYFSSGDSSLKLLYGM